MAASNSWDAYKDIVAWFVTGKVPFLGVACNEFTNTLLACTFLRANLPHRTHWWRLLLVTIIVAVGGSTVTSLLFGYTPGWLLNPRAFGGVLSAYLLAFHCPGDVFFRVYRQPWIRPIIDLVRGFALVQSIAGTIEMIAASPKLGETMVARGSWHGFVLAGTLAGGGGFLTAEFLNVLLLPVEQYRNPGLNGPAASSVSALWHAVLYTLVLRNPAQLPYAQWWYSFCDALLGLPLPDALHNVLGMVLGGAGTFISLPLATDARTAQALLSFSTIALQAAWILGPAFSQRAAARLLGCIPGFQVVVSPSAVGLPPVKMVDPATEAVTLAPAAVTVRPPGDAELFGYVRIPGWAGEQPQQTPSVATSRPASAPREEAAASRPVSRESTGQRDSGITRESRLDAHAAYGESPSLFSPSISASFPLGPVPSEPVSTGSPGGGASSPRSPFRPAGISTTLQRRRGSVSLSPTGGRLSQPSMRTKAGGVTGSGRRVVPPPTPTGGSSEGGARRRSSRYDY